MIGHISALNQLRTSSEHVGSHFRTSSEHVRSQLRTS